MPTLLLRFAVFAALSLSLCGSVMAAPVLPPSAIAFMPHRALYDMKLDKVKNGSNVSALSGSMMFEWADVCDGWAIQQHLTLHFLSPDNGHSDVTSTQLTWESKDGKQYSFNLRRQTDGKETEAENGKAALTADGGKATYALPAGKTFTLPTGTLFPSAHTRLILEKAMAGESFFTRRVFDGSDAEGSSDVSAFIDHARPYDQQTAPQAELEKNPLLHQTSWPVRLAFFAPDSTTSGTDSGEPDYEMDMDLLANGVIRSLHIDYGDFSVTGTLSALEALPAPACKG